MEATYIVDCGHHTIKYAGLSKRNKRTVEVLVKERRSPCNAYVADDERLRQSVPQLLSGELRTDEDLTLMLLLDTLTSQKSKAALLHSCFESFGCKKVCLHYTACTGLYAAGETSGVVVDVGYAGVQLSSVYQGAAQTALSCRLSSVGTRSLDCELHKLLPSGATEEAMDLMKAQCCGLAEQTEPLADLTLPDGTTLPCSALKRSEVHAASSALLFSTTSSVPDTLRLVFQKHVIRHPDAASWLRLGGGAQMDGVAEVLQTALTHPLCRHTPKELHLKDATHGPVSGGIILSQLNVFKSMCIGVSDYEEYGPDGCVRMQVVDAR